MKKYIFFISFVWFNLLSCDYLKDKKDFNGSSNTVNSIKQAIAVNATFPFGPIGLSGSKSSLFFPADDENYGKTLSIDNNSIDSISYYFGIKNETVSIEKPSFSHVEFIELDKNPLDYYYFDTIAFRSLDSCKYRLPDMGLYECYYFVIHSLKDSYGIYGNLLLKDSITNACKAINVFYEYGGDQNVSLKYFYISNNTINIFKGSAYDDGTSLVKNCQVNISGDGRIDVKRTVTFEDCKYKLYFNYGDKLSSGIEYFPACSIYPGNSEFRIEAQRMNGEASIKNIPYALDDMPANKSIMGDKDNAVYSTESNFLQGKSEKYVSIMDNIFAGGKKYSVYKHKDYNCYDSFCGSKHNHTTFAIGYTYFSPVYGVLFHTDGQMQFEILISIKKVDIPYQLILEILRKERVDQRIIDQYISDLKLKVG